MAFGFESFKSIDIGFDTNLSDLVNNKLSRNDSDNLPILTTSLDLKLWGDEL